MSTYIGEIPKQVDYRFDFSQRDIDLLTSILFDLTNSGGMIAFDDGGKFVPREQTMKDLKSILSTLDEVGMSVSNDYLSNFKGV